MAMSRSDASEALNEFFKDLVVLRRVPLVWLVPDESLLPPESVRLFYVDQTFLRHVVAGASAAGALTADDTPFDRGQAEARWITATSSWKEQVDQATAPYRAIFNLSLPGIPDSRPPDLRHLMQLTGFLLRSEAVRRFPGLRVTAQARFDPDSELVQWVGVPLLRFERVAPSILLVICLGLPDRIEIEEPDVGTRFGFDAPQQAGAPLTLQVRGADGELSVQPVAVPMRGNTRTVDMQALATRLAQAGAPGAQGNTLDSAALAFQLQQAAYIQIMQPRRADGLDPAVDAVDAERAADTAARSRAAGGGS